MNGARSSTRALVSGVAFAVLVGVAAAAVVPISFDSREELFEIPKGTYARHMAGDKRDVLPQRIQLVLGLRDVLVLRNLDDVPQIVGPTLLMPGQTFRLPFSTPSENTFSCTAHASGQLTIVVEAPPAGPWARLRWRAHNALAWISQP